jgi:apolipoprotein N-acyltransferase
MSAGEKDPSGATLDPQLSDEAGRAVRPARLTSGWRPWLWLVVGFVLLPFSMVQNVIPLAAWAAPIFLLRFSRTTKRRFVGWLGVFVAYEIAIAFATRGGSAVSVEVLLVSVLLFQVSRALVYSLAFVADRAIGSRLSIWPRLLVFPAAFTVADWFLSLLHAPNTTGSIAYSQFSSLALMQILSVTGMWGVTFLVTWCASTANLLWERGVDWRPVRRQVGVYVGVILAVLLFGFTRLAIPQSPSQSVEAATITLDSSVQQSAEAGIDWLALGQSSDARRAAVAAQLQPIINQLLARTEAALRGGAKIVVWAEGSGTIMEEDQADVQAKVEALAQEYGAYVEPAFAVIRRATSQYFMLNQAILVDPSGKILWTYEKSYPTEPVESYYAVPGTGVLPLASTLYGVMSTAICNDLHFPPLIRQAGSQGVAIFLSPVNDVHPFEMEDEVGATFRAVENGFSLIRPADYGTSTIVDPMGRVLASQDYFANSSGIMMTTVPTRGVRTIYSHIGDAFAYLCVAVIILLAALALLRRRQPTALPEPMKP